MRSTDGLPETAAMPGSPAASPQRHRHAGLRTWLVGTLAAFGLTAAGVFALATLADYRSTLEEGWRQAENTALLLASHGDHTLSVSAAMADRLAERIRRDGAESLRGADWSELASLAARSAEVDSLWIIGADGRLIANSLAAEPPRTDFSDREHVRAIQQGAESHLNVLLFGRISRVWFYAYNQAVRREGRLEAIVQVSTHGTAFRQLAAQLRLGPDAVLLLARPDGAPLMRWPLPEAGAVVPPLRIPTHGATRQEVVDESGRAMLLASRPSPSGQVVAAAGLARSHVVAPFQARLRRNGALGALAALLGLGMSAAALRAAAGEARARRELEARGAALATALKDRDGLVDLLSENEARLRLAQQAGEIGLWDWDLHTDRMVLVGATFRAWGLRTGVTRPSSARFLAAVHPEDRDRLAAAAVASLRGEGPVQTEFRILRRGPPRRNRWVATRWLAVRAEVLRGPGGVPRRMIGIAMDVTARRHAADALAEANTLLERRVAERTRDLAQTNARLRESEARFRGIFNATFQLIALLSTDGTVLEANDAALVEPGAEFLGHPLWEAPWLDGAREEVTRAVTRAATGEFVRQELAVTLPDGRSVAVDFSLKPVRDEEGLVSLLVAEARDISDLKAAQAQLHEAQKLDTLGRLTGGVAHDFNNLLMAVLANLRLARKRLPDGADARVARHIDGAIQGAERGAALTARLLAFARRQDLRPKPVDVAALLEGMRSLIERSCGPLVELRIEAEPGLPPALVDPNGLELALLNLAVNARDAMPEGGHLRITTAFAPPPEGLAGRGFLCISVTDTGFGMDEATRARASEAFFSTKAPGRGTGLGLFMVQGLATQSGGALRLDSAPGKGTAASIWLPIVEAAAPAEPAPGPVAEAAAPPASGMVLVVDDEPLILESTAALVADLGYRVVTAGSGEAALAALRSWPEIGLVLTDYAMPGITGAALARQVRDLRPGLPVVIATGYVSPEPGAEPLPGDLPRLDKPYGQDELARVLAQAMEAGRVVLAG
ncbi:MAG TPA: ATP-binding protein [Acetobacteraceae bacterium]|nr:ATP-binding protein [Acetobacteraceae bacterium]